MQTLKFKLDSAVKPRYNWQILKDLGGTVQAIRLNHDGDLFDGGRIFLLNKTKLLKNWS